MKIFDAFFTAITGSGVKSRVVGSRSSEKKTTQATTAATGTHIQVSTRGIIYGWKSQYRIASPPESARLSGMSMVTVVTTQIIAAERYEGIATFVPQPRLHI